VSRLPPSIDRIAAGFDLLVLEELTSRELMEQDAPACPLCGAPALATFLRAGLESFVAALICPGCRCLFRAVDAMSLDPAPLDLRGDEDVAF
jgi:uncharacterized protein YbaR (Trm112 family)